MSDIIDNDSLNSLDALNAKNKASEKIARDCPRPVNESIDKKLIEHYKNAEHVSIVPLLKLIFITTGIDLSEKYKLKSSVTSDNADTLTAGELILANNTNKIKIRLEIVDNDYDLLDSINSKNIFENPIDTLCIPESDDSETKEELKEDSNEIKLKKTIISAISFLTQACLVCFNMIKNDNKDILEYNLYLDNNTTIYIDNTITKRIGIVFI